MWVLEARGVWELDLPTSQSCRGLICWEKLGVSALAQACTLLWTPLRIQILPHTLAYATFGILSR